jgi:hypothetical protein
MEAADVRELRAVLGRRGYAVRWARAAVDDVPLLAAMNSRLIRDEGHRNPMTLPELEERMR